MAKVSDSTVPDSTVPATASGNRTTPGRFAACIEIALVSAGIGLGYLVIYHAQRQLFLNGKPSGDPRGFLRLGSDFLAALASLHTYWIATAAVVVIFTYAVIRSRAASWRRMAWLPLATGAAGYVVALLARPSLSIDPLSYLSHGWIAAQPGGNPYLTASAAVAQTPYGPALTAEGWFPVHPQTPYGPLWTHVERLAYILSGGDVRLGLLLLKATVVVAVFGSTWLIWLITRRLRPGWELPAALAFLWNPVVVVEFGMDGHNDAVAIAFLLFGIWATMTGRGFWAVVGIGLGTLTKFTPAMFALPVLVVLLRRRRSWPSILGQVAAGIGVVAGLGWLLYRRFWASAATFDGLRASSIPSPSWSIAGWLGVWFGEAPFGEPDPRSRMILAAILVVAVIAVSWQRTDRGLIIASGVIAVAALAVTPTYWPWYSALPIAVLAVRGTWVSTAQVVVLTIGSRIAAPYGDLFLIGVKSYEEAMKLSSLWGIDVPVLVCLGLAVGGGIYTRVRGLPIPSPSDRARPDLKAG